MYIKRSLLGSLDCWAVWPSPLQLLEVLSWQLQLQSDLKRVYYLAISNMTCCLYSTHEGARQDFATRILRVHGSWFMGGGRLFW